ncbi:MAG TPA: class II aldolase/adducin family protein [Streptosporangiaceae bacterium]|jgi:ribulose-5-phosphate 4-epimerase/fuculose-1-phosphate aldolase
MSVTALPDATAAGPGDPVEAERASRKAAVAATLRLFAQLGYEFGFNGHITVRDPGPGDLYWANPWGVPFAVTTASDLVLVDCEGTVLEGRHPTSQAGFRSTHVLHYARPDATAVVHVHSPYGFTWSSSPRLLEPVNTDAALLHGLQAVHDDFGRPDGKSTADSLGPTARVLIQRSHGFVTIGESVEEAAFYFMAAERAAHGQLLLAAAGRGELVADELRAKWTLTPQTARDHFAPHLRQILHDHPEVSQ